MLVHDDEGRVTGVRGPAGQQLVEQAAHRVQIRAVVGLLAVDLLGGEVGGGADGHAGPGQPGGHLAQRLGDAEVDDLDRARGGQHHIAGLDVAVHDGVLVAVLQGLQHLPGDLDGLRHGHRPVAQHLAQGAALDVLHHQIRLDGAVGAVLAHIVHGGHTGVVERGRGVRLALEAGAELRLQRQLGGEGLHGDGAAQPVVDRPVDRAHSPLPELLHQLVALPQYAVLHPMPPRPSTPTGRKTFGTENGFL